MRKKQTSTLLLVVMVFAIASPMIGKAQASPQTILEVYPETTIVEMGETFTVDVNIVDVADLFGYDFKLKTNPYILEVVDVTAGPFLPGIWSHINYIFTGQPTDDADVVPDGILDICDWAFITWHYYDPPNVGPGGYDARADIYPVGGDGLVDIRDGGKLNGASTNTYTDMPSAIHCNYYSYGHNSGSGTLATITYKVRGFGITALDLFLTKLSPGCGEPPIPHEVRDGTVIVSGSPAEAMQFLITNIESWNLDGGVENGLTTKLKAAIHLFNQNNLNGAINKLRDFINKVEALRSKKLTDWQADYLIANAQAIIDAIG